MSSTRRSFLAGGAAAAGASALGAAPAAARPRPPRRVDVAIVGGGLAGLYAARQLQRKGRSVVVLEASSRLGGRVWQVPVGSSSSEGGGEWVAPGHKAIKALMGELDLKLFPTYDTGDSVLDFAGTVTRFSGPFPPVGEAALAELAPAITTLNALAATVPVERPQDTPNAHELDRQTVGSWIAEHATLPGSRFLLNTAVGGPVGGSPDDTSLLATLFLIQSEGGVAALTSVRGGDQDSRIVGGTGQLVEGLARQVGRAHIVTDAPVQTIDQRGGRVRVQTPKGPVVAGRVIVATPPTMAGQIRYEPPMPGLRAQFTQRAPMGWSIKCFAQYPTPFWRAEGLSGITYGDGLFHATFDNTPASGSPGIIYALITGADARLWGPRPAAERRAAVLDRLARSLGERARRPSAYVEVDWAGVTWDRGGAGMTLPPGVLTQFGGDVVRRSVGRIHWAGTDTESVYFGSMNGALTSAQRAVDEVLRAG